MPVSFCRPEDRTLILWAAILASSMGFIDSSVTSIAIPAMRTALGATLVEAQWINAAYLLVLSSLVLAGGAAGDRFGTARVFVWGIWVFVAGSIACAVAMDPGQMIAARAVIALRALAPVAVGFRRLGFTLGLGNRGLRAAMVTRPGVLRLFGAVAERTGVLGPPDFDLDLLHRHFRRGRCLSGRNFRRPRRSDRWAAVAVRPLRLRRTQALRAP